MLIKNSHCTGCKESQFYSLSFGQVAAGMTSPRVILMNRIDYSFSVCEFYLPVGRVKNKIH